MFKLKNFFILTVAFTALMFTGCQHEPNPIESFQDFNQGQPSKITIPIGATVDSAYFYINTTTALSAEVTIHRITSSWEEMSVTWNSFSSGFNASSEGSFIPSAPGWYAVDITSLFTSWVDSTYPNYGVLLKEENPDQLQFYTSREDGNSPYIKVWWTLNSSGASDSTDASADSYINSSQIDDNFGNSTELITGWDDNTEFQTLVNFEIEQVPVGGCTRSFGYWKTHSVYGPAPYDTSWVLLGEDSTFFLSEQSNFEVLWTQPRGGNAYYILAHQYIATNLNLLNGADPSDVQEAFDDATELFNTYTPEYVFGLRGNDPIRQQFISLKDTLDQYNNGYIGPGNCGDNKEEYPY